MSIHDHELLLPKDPTLDDGNEDFHMLNNYHENQNISPVSRSLSESDISELCLPTTGDATIGVANTGSPHMLHGSLPPSDDELHQFLQYDDEEIHQLQQHHNLNNNRRAMLSREVVVPVSMEGSAQRDNGLLAHCDRYDEQHHYSVLSTRNSLPPPPILPPKKGNIGNRELNVHPPQTMMHRHQNRINNALPYNNNRNNENLNQQHAKSSRLNKMTSQQHSKEIKNFSTVAANQQQLHEQQRNINYHHQNFEPFNTLGSQSGSSSGSSEIRYRNYNQNKPYNNNQNNPNQEEALGGKCEI